VKTLNSYHHHISKPLGPATATPAGDTRDSATCYAALETENSYKVKEKAYFADKKPNAFIFCYMHLKPSTVANRCHHGKNVH